MRHLLFVILFAISSFTYACPTGASTELLNKASFDKSGVDAVVLGMVFMRGAECGTDFSKKRLEIANLSSKIYNEVRLAPSPRCVSAVITNVFRCPQ